MTTRGNGQPCPNCGGNDRFVPRQRLGGYRCTHCGYLETDVAAIDIQAKEQRQLTDEQRQDVYRAYALIAQYAHEQLYSQAGAAALDYLHRRGLNDDTILGAGLGYLPDGDNREMASWLWRTDTAAYHSAALGGVTARQGRLLNLARDSVVFPYVALVDAESGQTETRMLRFRSMQGRGYRSPAGVAMFAGGTPCLFNGHSISQDGTVLLTEGELKALAAQQAGIPAVAQPGIGYLADGMIQQLAGRRVILCYDTEARKDPFTLSPGENFTTCNGEKLTATKQRRRLWYLDNLKEKELTDELKAEREALQAEIGGIEARAIRLQVARLPRLADEQKVDIDSYALAHGAEALQQVVNAAQPFELWYQRHSGGGYRFDKGSIHNGKPLANYQARVTEHITVSDGQSESIVFRLAARTPSGALRYTDIEQATWADNRAALQALRCAAGEATAIDEGLDTLKAVKILSNQGDAPAQRRVYTATGWEQIDGKWFYLTGDGAVCSDGATSTYRADIDANTQGNHYALCDDRGSAQEGWAAWRHFLMGDVCPQHIALLMAGNAALALVHRFTGDAAKPMLWIHNETGAHKTALVRAGVMALWGSKFTAVRADGAAGIKWTGSYKGLELGGYSYRDVLLPIDDYKPDMITPRDFTRFVQNYSEGSSHTRATIHLRNDKARPVRGIVIATGEDVPHVDTGLAARITTLSLQPGIVSTDNLAELQAAGAAGHLVAFWRGFVQGIASALDKYGADGLQALLQQRIAEDDDTLPGHKRASGALRQNRAAFLLLSGWLQQAGYLTADERADLEAAHLQARKAAADSQAQRQQENRYSTIFLQLVDSLLQQGFVIEQKELYCPECGGPLHREITGWHCGNDTLGDSKGVCHYRLSSDKILGFRTAKGQVGLNVERCWELVQEMKRKQGQRIPATQQAVLQQLDTDGLLPRTDGKNGYTTKAHNPATQQKQRCLLLHAGAIDTGGPDTGGQVDEAADGAILSSLRAHAAASQPEPQPAAPAARDESSQQKGSGSSGKVPDDNQQPGTNFNAAESAKKQKVPEVPEVPEVYIYIGTENSQPGQKTETPIEKNRPGTSGTSGTFADIRHQEAKKKVPDNPEQPGTCPDNPEPFPAALAPADNQDGELRTIPRRGRRVVSPAPQPGTISQPSERLQDSDILLPPGWELHWIASTALWQAQHRESGRRTSVHPRTREGRAALLKDIRRIEEDRAA